MKVTRHAATAAWWSMLETTARYSVQFLVTIVLARLLTPEDFGLVAILTVLTITGSVLVDGGFSTALIQRQDSSVDDETSIFVFSSVVGIGMALLLIVTAPWLAHILGEAELPRYLPLLSLLLPLAGLAAVPDAVLSRRLDFASRARAQLIASLLSGGLGIGLALTGHGAWSLVWQAVTAAAFRTLYLWALSGWRPRGRARVDSLRSLSGFGGYMFLANGLDSAYGQLQPLLIGTLFDARTLGYYTLAQSAQNAPASLMGSVLQRVGLPVFSVVAQDRHKLMQGLRLSLRVSMYVFTPTMIALSLVADPLVRIVYGDAWRMIAPFLSILALGTALWPIHVLNLAALGAIGRSDLVFRVDVVKKAIAVALVLAASPWGPFAIAWSTVVISVLGAFINTYYVSKFLGYGLVQQLADQTATLVATAIAAGAGWLMLHFLPFSIWTLGVTLLTTGIAYLGASVLLRHGAIRDLADIWRATHPSAARQG